MSQRLGLPQLKADGRRRYALRTRCRLMELPLEIRSRIWRLALEGSTATRNGCDDTDDDTGDDTSDEVSGEWRFSNQVDLLCCSKAILQEARPVLRNEIILVVLGCCPAKLELYDWMWSTVREVHITAQQRFGLIALQATGSIPNLRRIVVLQAYSLRCHCRQREVTDEWLLDQAPSFLDTSGRGMNELAAAIPECQVSVRYSIDVRGKRWRYVECEVDFSRQNLRRLVDNPVRKTQPKWKRVYN